MRTFHAAIIGNPNSGKTTLFNALTGLRQKVGNYPGVTVERKEGRAALTGRARFSLLDLPGLYSLTPHSPDEVIARDVLLGILPDKRRPDVILNVVDASNLERNLYLTSQILDIGLPVVVALTMTDTLLKSGKGVDSRALSAMLGAPVVPVVASKKEGLQEVLEALAAAAAAPAPEPAWTPDAEVQESLGLLQDVIQQEQGLPPRAALAEAVSMLMQDGEPAGTTRWSPAIRSRARQAREQLAARDIDFPARVIDARYGWSERACAAALHHKLVLRRRPISTNDRIDRVVMHRLWGYVLFFVVMTVVFQAIFTLGQAPADWVKEIVSRAGILLTRVLPAGDLRDLINDGVLGGVGTTLSFLPQILLLFFFISILDDSGYMPRAAFLMDRLMSKVGLHGKSFIPLVSSFACAIPGIMATRTIGDRKARLITIMVAPLMSCSARLPVYLLMTSAFVPNTRVFGIGRITLLTLPGVTFVAMYFLGMAAAFCMAWCFHRTLLRGLAPTFLMELPPYRLPSVKTAVLQMLERAGLFLKRAGTIILAVAVLVWFLSTYPRRPDLSPDRALAHSYLGIIGRVMEPAIAPLGFDWKIGVGMASSFVAREVFVSTMGTVYNVDRPESETGQADLGRRMQADVNPQTGHHVFTPLVAISLMVYYVLAMQCMSTVAVVRRETNGWKWPLFQLAYMTVLAWGVTFMVYHVGVMAGWG